MSKDRGMGPAVACSALFTVTLTLIVLNLFKVLPAPGLYILGALLGLETFMILDFLAGIPLKRRRRKAEEQLAAARAEEARKSTPEQLLGDVMLILNSAFSAGRYLPPDPGPREIMSAVAHGSRISFACEDHSKREMQEMLRHMSDMFVQVMFEACDHDEELMRRQLADLSMRVKMIGG